MRLLLFMLLLAAACLPVHAQQTSSAAPALDLRSLKEGVAAPPHQVLVLGTAHLSQRHEFTQRDKTVRAQVLDGLLDRLQAFKPQIIAIEALSGLQCEQLTAHRWRYSDTADSYCQDAGPAQKAAGLTLAQAAARVEDTLRQWPAQPTPAQRRALIAAMLAANERASAVVQWLRLPPSERRAGDGLDATLLPAFEKYAASSNEDVVIAAALAARLGLERVHAVDDHTADVILTTLDAPTQQAYGAFLQAHWSQPSALRDAMIAQEPHAFADADSVLAYYRFLNDVPMAAGSVQADMAGASRRASPQQFGARYMAWWEARNLRMIANLREVMGQQPGARVLAIVGATHKLHYDAYLDLMHDVRLVDVQQVLAPRAPVNP